MIAAGEPVSATAVISGLAYLDALQNADSSLPYAAGDDPASDANSTACVVQALVAAGEDTAQHPPNPQAAGRWC